MIKKSLPRTASWILALPLLLLPNALLAQDIAPQADTASPTIEVQANRFFTLREALVAAYGYDPRIKAAMETVKASHAALNVTRAARLPQISATSSYGTLDATVNGERQSYAGQQISNGFSVSAPIATFGRQDAAEISAASQLASAKIDFEQKKSILFDDVVQSYFGLLFSEQVYRLKLENKSLLEKQLAEASERFDREAITITELRAVRTRLNNANIDMLNASASYVSQKQRLASLIGKADIGNLSVDSANEFLQKLPATLDDAKTMLLATSPSIKEANEAITRAKAEVENSRANFFPQLSVQGGASSSSANGETTNQQYATLNLNMALGNGVSGLLDQTRVMAQLKRAQYNMVDGRNLLLEDFQNRWENYQNYNQIVKDRFNNVKQYEKNLPRRHPVAVAGAKHPNPSYRRPRPID